MDRKYSLNPNTPAFWEEFYSEKDPNKERQNIWLYDLLQGHLPDRGHILEIGCGMGQTIREMKKRKPGLDFYGCDISKEAIEKAKILGGGMFFVKNGEQLNQKDKWDFVLCVQSLEHFDNPQLCVEVMARSLKPKCKMLLTVPYPMSSLDNGVNKHYIRFYPKDFQRWLKGCKVEKLGINHMVITWVK
jgi:SAM-dependent methyltransferase